MNVISVDPGKATGIARMIDGEFSSCILQWQEAMSYIEAQLNTGVFDLAVCEDYRISKQTLTKAADAHWPMGGIGVVTYIAARQGVRAIKYSPSEAKAFSTDDKLRRVGWYKPGAGHDNDAARHLLLALVNHRAIDLHVLLPSAT